MAVPKRKTSKSRKNKRRSSVKLSGPTIVTCPHCHEPKQAHTVCANNIWNSHLPTGMGRRNSPIKYYSFPGFRIRSFPTQDSPQKDYHYQVNYSQLKS
jgi:large subunit ribosomal protein L32